MFIPNKSTSHLACVSESDAAASQIEHGGWMCWDQLELSRRVHVFWHGHGLNMQINNEDKSSLKLSSINLKQKAMYTVCNHILNNVTASPLWE